MYGTQYIYETHIANQIDLTIFGGIGNLNPWRLRVFIHILDVPGIPLCLMCFVGSIVLLMLKYLTVP